jgi:DNA-binding SARP family transcriptional activator
MPDLSLFLLGVPRLEREGRAVDVERHKALALLAYLAVTGAAHRRDGLAALLWPELDQARARAALRRTLSALNVALSGDWLETDRETISLLPSAAFWLDVNQFRHLLAQCRKHGHPETEVCAECLAPLAEAAALYRGDFLSGFTLRDAPAFDDWQFFQTETLRRELASALERLTSGHSARREFEAPIGYARRWLALDPLHEPAQRQLMRLYAWAGQRNAALRQYAECVRLLERELGVPPQTATTDLYNAIKENRLPPAAELPPSPPAPFAWTMGALLHNRYRIDSEVGRGGMGVVYRAHDTLLDRAVAIKVLSETGVGAEGRLRLLREAQAVARLDHPHIVPVYDVGFADEINDTPFIVMQLVAGKSLREAGPLPLPQILTVASQLCDALGHAHQRGLIHRDVKPENVVLTPEGAAKLMDFGLAHSQGASHLTQAGALIGTPFYLAPEQIRGEPVDGRADLYALGVILYELTTGRLPFAGDDVLNVISQHLHSPVEPPRTHRADLPPALDALIVRLLSKQPADRPGSADEVRAALESLRRPTAAPPTPTAAYSTLDRIVRGQLVGRERELAEAGALWSRAASGEGSILLVSGEPGIGKTRLVRELVGLAQAAGARVLADGCHAEGGPPYAPLAGMMREAFENPSGPDLPDFILADLLTLAPHLRPHYPHVAVNPPLDPQFEQQRVFDSFVAWCEMLAAHAPLLLLVEDVHWADGGTLALLRHLARRARRARLLLVMTYRDTEVESDQAHPLNAVLLDLNRERLAEQLRLARLSREHTRDLLSAMLSTTGEITPEFLDGLYRETEGNPFFVEEVCKGLIEQGKLYHAGGTWRRADMHAIFIPSSVRGAIMARVERLPAQAQDALRLAAILGREFDFETLQAASRGEALSSPDEDALIAALERAERAQLIGESPRAVRLAYTFAHALIPFALRESLSGLRRQRLHRRAAATIESLRPNDVEALAYHFAAAGERDKALQYSRLAAERAEALYAYDTAIQHLQIALDLIEAGEQNETRLALLESLADAHRLRGERTKAILIYQEALSLWPSLMKADKWIAVRLHRKIGETFLRLKSQANVERFEAISQSSLEHGLRLVEGEPPHPESVRLLTTLADDKWNTRAQQDWEASEHYARAAVAMGEQLEAPIELSAALGALDTVYGARGLYRERVQLSQRRLALSRDPRFGDVRERVSLLCQTGNAQLFVGDYAQALPPLLEAERLADQIRDVSQHVYALGLQAQCFFGLDRWDEMLQIEAKRLALEERYGRDRVDRMCFYCGLSANIFALRGEFDQSHIRRDEAYTMMAGNWGGPLETWPPVGHY